MAATTKVPLAGTTSNRKWYLDVNTGTVETPVWTGVFGITEQKRIQDSSTQDDSDMDNGGWKSEAVTALKHGFEGKVRRAPTAASATVYDPGQEKIRTTALLTGTKNRLQYRCYEMEEDGPRVESYQGFASCVWNPDGGNMEQLDTVSFKLLGQGRLTTPAHPAAA